MTHTVRKYIDRRQTTVAQWVALQNIFKACVKQDTGYEGRGRKIPPWWRQTVAETELQVPLENILAEARERRRLESGRHNKRVE